MTPFITKEEEETLRSVQGETLSGMKSQVLKCPSHKNLNYSKWCFTDQTLICDKCAETADDGGHFGHHHKLLKDMVPSLLTEKRDIRKQIVIEFEKLDSAIDYFSGIEELFVR